MTAFLYEVRAGERVVFDDQIDGCVDFGRVDPRAPGPELVVLPSATHPGRKRVNIAKKEEVNISRDGVRIEPLSDTRVRITNLSAGNPILINHGISLEKLASAEFLAPLNISFGAKSIYVKSIGDEHMESLAAPTIMPGDVSMMRRSGITRANLKNTDELVERLSKVIAVLNSAATSNEFFDRAAEAMLELLGVDCARVLTRHTEEWSTERTAYRDSSDSGKVGDVSQRMLKQLVQEKRTIWKNSTNDHAVDSLAGVNLRSVVIAPFCNSQGDVIGALYGDVWRDFGVNAPLSKVEAQWASALAGGVSVGLARIQEQQSALKAEVRFEQFFGPDLARHLAAQPELLAGRELNVTVLFADIRGFSRISEKLTSAETMDWIGEVMEVLSLSIAAHKGVVVDYIGDEIMAMWGAPEEDVENAEDLACQAAQAMIAALDELNVKWEPRLGVPIRLGIGINTGLAHVGNTGAKQRQKYGPLGKNVNLASRVQGATKYLRADILMTASTFKGLTDQHTARRLCTVRVVNIVEPVDLYQLPVGHVPGWQHLKDRYEEALRQFEQRELRQAASILGQLIVEFPDDGPALALLARIAKFLEHAELEFTSVLELAGK